MVGSFDAGFGTWYPEDLVGKRLAKDLWYTNWKLTAPEALEIGLVNRVVPDAELRERTIELALTVADRGSFALAAVKHAFHARHSGVTGMSRVSHDLLLRSYLRSDEAHELSQAFAAKRRPDVETFGH